MSIILTIPDWVSRYKQSLKAIAIRGLAQAVGTIASFVVLAGHGANSFGLFSVLIAASGMSVVLEWGLPLKVQNEISRGSKCGEYDLRWFLFQSGFLPHLLVNLASALGLWLLAPSLIDEFFPSEVGQVLAQQHGALLAIFLVAAATGATYHGRSVLFGLGYINAGFTIGMLAALMTLAIVALGIVIGASATALSVVVASIPLLERLFACAYCFGRRQTLLRHPSMPPPLLGSTPKRSGRSVALMFLYLQVLALIASNVDTIWAARANSLQSVAEYAFLIKLYSVALLVGGILNTSSMPKLAVEAHGVDGGRRTVRGLIQANLVVMVGMGLLIVLASNPVYSLISGEPTDLRPLAVIMLVDACLLALRGVLTTYVNAAEVLWLNVTGNTMFAIAAIGLKILLVDRLGIYGLVVANIAAYLLFLMPFQLVALWRGIAGGHGQVH